MTILNKAQCDSVSCSDTFTVPSMEFALVPQTYVLYYLCYTVSRPEVQYSSTVVGILVQSYVQYYSVLL